MPDNKIQSLFRDETFTAAFVAASTPESGQVLLREQGVDLPLEEVKQIKLLFEKIQRNELDLLKYVDDNGQLKAELTLEELEAAAGGTTPATVVISLVSGSSATALGFTIATFFQS